MKEELIFLINCLEEYKKDKKISTKNLIRLFEQYQVCEYIKSFCSVLNSNDYKYLIKDIDLYIEAKKNDIIYQD